MKTKIIFSFVFITFFSLLKAQNDTVCITMRPSAASGQDVDAQITNQSPTTNFGTYPDYFSQTWTCTNTCVDRALIRFDLSSIPVNATIVSAKLYLYVDNNSTNGITGSPTYGSNNAGWLMRITSPWTVNTVTWNTQPTTTSVDEVTVPQSTSTSENYTLNIAQLISDIIASGNNYGIMMMQQNETSPYQSLIFGSCNNSDTNLHPMLQLCYVVDTTKSTCITMQPSAAKGQDIDAQITNQSPTSNFGTYPDYFTQTWTCTNTCIDRALIRFDLSSIPTNATITKATLNLYADNNSTNGINGSPTYRSNNAGWLVRITSPWTVNTVTWNAQPTTTSVNEVTIPQSTSTSENYTLSITQLITDIIASGNNYGLMMMQQNETSPYQSLIFGSSNNSDTTLHPKLEICYNLPTSINTLKYSSHIQVYPNPAHSELVFKLDNLLSSSLHDCVVELFNIMGEKVRTVSLYPYQTTISINELPRGLYMYRIINNSTPIQSGKIELQ